ncbi:MAG TPA: phosphodiester glycosidase family protein, partial [Terriglobia bacterium]|nr:phosphodiester glycosidase family protein [Terriglobia bacterium]
EHAQLALNGHFFLPFPSASPDANLVGFAASNGNVYSAFESPSQSYAIVADAAAINIDASNHASIIHRDPAFSDGRHIRESIMIWNALSGSAQIVTNGEKTIPAYKDAQHPDGLLTPGGLGDYSNTNSWYGVLNARTAIGLTRDNHTLVLFTVDRAAGSLGMTSGEVADMLIRDYGVVDALNLDGGGSTTLAMENPATHTDTLVNVSDDNPSGRSVGSNLAVFANTISGKN